MWRGSSSPSVTGLPLALDLDGVLADTRPLWDAWLEDVARRTRVELDVPADRQAAAVVLDEALGDWRPLLTRFAADRAPLSIRPRPDTNAALRRLVAAGARIGVFTDAPRELAEIALAHAGAARQVEIVGTLPDVKAALGDATVVVRSREELAECHYDERVEHDLSDRRFDLILERLDRIADELAKTNKRLDNDENFLRLARELATLNESLQALAYAALGQQAPQVRRRRSA